MPNFVPIGHAVAEILMIFDFSRWRPPAILDSQNFEILPAHLIRKPECVTLPNFVPIGETTAEMADFGIFQDGSS